MQAFVIVDAVTELLTPVCPTLYAASHALPACTYITKSWSHVRAYASKSIDDNACVTSRVLGVMRRCCKVHVESMYVCYVGWCGWAIQHIRER